MIAKSKRLTPLPAFEEAAECLRTLAHPHRLRMIQMLLRDRYTVGELAESCGIPSHMASEHLRLMQRCGFLINEKEGRKAMEFQALHVTFARNVPLDQLNPAALMQARNGTANEPLYVVCQSGGRSRQACEAFLKAGYANVVNVEGGTKACEQAGLP